jgi:hypothetical protein
MERHKVQPPVIDRLDVDRRTPEEPVNRRHHKLAKSEKGQARQGQSHRQEGQTNPRYQVQKIYHSPRRGRIGT